MIRFDFPGLSPTQAHALSVLIDNGGNAPADRLCIAANNAPGGHRGGVTKPTILSLVRRGHLDHDERDRNRVQVTPYAVRQACLFATNPHPVPVMRARAEALAHSDTRRDNPPPTG